MAKPQEKSDESSGSESLRTKTAGRSTTGSGRPDAKTSAGEAGMAAMKEQTAEVLGHAQQQAASIVGMASQQATSQLGVRKDLAATTLGAVATALHEAGQQLEQQDETAAAGYVDMAAGQVEQLATMLREQDINQLIGTTAEFARRQPALFLAGAFALGFIGTRFLKSTSPSRGQSFGSGGNESSNDRGRSRADAYGSGSWTGGYGSSSGLSTGANSGFGGAGSFAGSGGAGNYNSGIGSSSAMSSGRQEGFSGAAGTRSGSDWSSRDGAGLGSEGS